MVVLTVFANALATECVDPVQDFPVVYAKDGEAKTPME